MKLAKLCKSPNLLKRFSYTTKIVVGSFIFISLYSGALYSLAASIHHYVPGETLDPAYGPADSVVDVGGGGLPAGAITQVQYNNGGVLGADANFIRATDGSNFGVQSDIGSGKKVTFEEAANVLGIPIDGLFAAYSDNNFTTGFTGLLAGDFTGVGGQPNSMIAGYQGFSGGIQAKLQTSYDAVPDRSTVILSAENSQSGGSLVSAIQLNVEPGNTSLSFNFGGSGQYSFPTTSPALGQVLGYVSSNQLGWVANGNGGGKPNIGDGIGGANINQILYTNTLGVLEQNQNLSFNDSSYAFDVGTSFGTVIHSNNGGGMGNIAELGDVNNSHNETKFGVYDGTRGIIGITDGSFNIRDSSSNKFFNIDVSSKTYSLGGLDYVNGAKIIIDNNAGSINNIIHGPWIVRDASPTGDIFGKIDTALKTAQFGDIQGFGNKTLSTVNDQSGYISLQADNVINLQNSAGNYIASFYPTAGSANILMGDVSNVGNHTNFQISDGGGFALFQVPHTNGIFYIQDDLAHKWFNIDAAASTVSLGDVTGALNKTFLTINDANQLVTIKSTNGVLVDDNNSHMCTIDPNGGTCTSDERLKTNITDLPQNTLDTLMNLRTVMYTWNSGRDLTTEHIGFLAQNVQQLYPELVGTDPNGFLGVNYANITPVIVEGLRELNIKVTALADLTTPHNSLVGQLIA